MLFFIHYSAHPEIYTYRHTPSLHDALPISLIGIGSASVTEAGGTTTITITFDDADNVQSCNSSFTLDAPVEDSDVDLTGVKITANAKDITSGVTGSDSATTTIVVDAVLRSEEHTSELQSLMRTSSAVFCLKKKTN